MNWLFAVELALNEILKSAINNSFIANYRFACHSKSHPTHQKYQTICHLIFIFLLQFTNYDSFHLLIRLKHRWIAAKIFGRLKIQRFLPQLQHIWMRMMWKSNPIRYVRNTRVNKFSMNTSSIHTFIFVCKCYMLYAEHSWSSTICCIYWDGIIDVYTHYIVYIILMWVIFRFDFCFSSLLAIFLNRNSDGALCEHNFIRIPAVIMRRVVTSAVCILRVLDGASQITHWLSQTICKNRYRFYVYCQWKCISYKRR